MKRLHELTDEELVKLTDEEYSTLVDLECMYEGAPLSIEVPKYKEIPIIPQSDVEIYGVLGLYIKDKEEAENLLNLINNLKSCVELDYEYSTGYDYKYVKEKDNVNPNKKINTIKAYSRDMYNSVKATLQNIKSIKEHNEEVQDDFDENVKKRNAVIAEIDDAIYNAENSLEEIARAVKVYKKYLELSDNNEVIAKKFFEESKYSCLLDTVLEKIND